MDSNEFVHTYTLLNNISHGDCSLTNGSHCTQVLFGNSSVNDSREYPPEVVRLFYVALFIQQNYIFFIFAIGFPANLACIATILRMSNMVSSTLYVIALAVVDNLAILSKMVKLLLDQHGVEHGDFGCKMLVFLSNYLPALANWVLVLMAAERYAAVRYPLQFGQHWSPRSTRLLLLGLSSGLLVVFLHFFWTITAVFDRETGGSLCNAHPVYERAYKVWHWINVAAYAFLPCFMLLIFNVFIVKCIRRSSGVQKSLTTARPSGSSALMLDHQRQITLMLVSASIVLIVLTLPRCLGLIVFPYLKPSSPYTEVCIDLVDQITYILCDATHAVNFYFYFLSARKFRQHFLNLLFCRKKSKHTPLRTSTLRTSTMRSTRVTRNLTVHLVDEGEETLPLRLS